MFKKCFLAISLTLCLTTVVGCKTNGEKNSAGLGVESLIEKDDFSTFLTVDSAELAEQLAISQVNSRYHGDLLEVNVRLSSQYKKTQRLQYQFTWFDKQGFVVEGNRSAWQPLILHGFQDADLVGVAPTAKASSYKLYVR